MLRGVTRVLRGGAFLAVLIAVCTLPAAAQAADGPAAPPLQPLLAWAVAPDGAVFVLDASHTIHELDAHTLAPLRRSEPLAQVISPGPAYLAADDDDIWVGSPVLGNTLQLSRSDFDERASIPAYGRMALDPGRELFLLADKGVLGYDVTDPTAAPRIVLPPWSEEQFVGEIPLDLHVDVRNRQLYVVYIGDYGSPPHDRQFLSKFDLVTLDKSVLGNYLGYISRPALTTEGEAFVVVPSYAVASSDLASFDASGAAQVAQTLESMQGPIAVSPKGDWIYAVQDRGLHVYRRDDLALVSVLPFTAPPPSDLLLSPAGDLLYLFGQGWATALSTGALPTLGVPLVSPFPAAWSHNFFRYRRHDPIDVENHGISFVVGSDGSLFRSTDGGEAWQLNTSLRHPDRQYVEGLSISPEFTRDRTVVARVPGGETLLRSTDGGASWDAWLPRIAFTSERDGNREIYTADAQGGDVRRLTAHPGDDENPAWSPGWTRVVFQSKRNGNWDLFSVRAGCDPQRRTTAATCDLRQLTTDPADDLLPAWSPDGRSIAFVSLRDGNAEIYLMDHDGGNQRRLTRNPAGDWRPAWLPNSGQLLFTTDRRGDNDLYLLWVPNADMATSGEPNIQPIVATAAGERDAAVTAQNETLFVSDHDGEPRVYSLTPFALPPNDFEENPYLGWNEAKLPGGHPSPLDVAGSYHILMDVGAGDNADIVALTYIGAANAQPIIASPGYDAQPAGGPTWWVSQATMPTP